MIAISCWSGVRGQGGAATCRGWTRLLPPEATRTVLMGNVSPRRAAVGGLDSLPTGTTLATFLKVPGCSTVRRSWVGWFAFTWTGSWVPEGIEITGEGGTYVGGRTATHRWG